MLIKNEYAIPTDLTIIMTVIIRVISETAVMESKDVSVCLLNADGCHKPFEHVQMFPSTTKKGPRIRPYLTHSLPVI